MGAVGAVWAAGSSSAGHVGAQASCESPPNGAWPSTSAASSTAGRVTKRKRGNFQEVGKQYVRFYPTGMGLDGSANQRVTMGVCRSRA